MSAHMFSKETEDPTIAILNQCEEEDRQRKKLKHDHQTTAAERERLENNLAEEEKLLKAAEEEVQVAESEIEGSDRHISLVVARKGELLDNLSKVEGENNKNAEEERNIKSTTTKLKLDYLKQMRSDISQHRESLSLPTDSEKITPMAYQKLPTTIFESVSKLDLNQRIGLYLEFLKRYLKCKDQRGEGSATMTPLDSQ